MAAEIFVYATEELTFELRTAEGEKPVGIFDGIKEAIVTLSQGGGAIEKRLSDGEIGLDDEQAAVNVRFRQEDTARLQGGTSEKPKSADVQVNLYYHNTDRDVTHEAKVPVYRNLHAKRMQ